jgi:hypothetical protein
MRAAAPKKKATKAIHPDFPESAWFDPISLEKNELVRNLRENNGNGKLALLQHGLKNPVKKAFSTLRRRRSPRLLPES